MAKDVQPGGRLDILAVVEEETPSSQVIPPQVKISVGQPSSMSAADQLAAALSKVTVHTQPRKGRLSVYRLPNTVGITPGEKMYIPHEATSGILQSVAILTEDPNIAIRLLLDDQDYGASIADLVQRQQAFLLGNDWTLTRQDPNVTPPQYAMMVAPSTWQWHRSFEFALAVPQDLTDVTGLAAVNVDQMVIKRLIY